MPSLAHSRLLGLLREAILSVPFAVMVYLIVKQVGPWRWFVELQLLLFNTFFPRYTFAACLMLALGVSGLLHIALSMSGWPAHPVLVRALEWALGLPRWLGIVLILGLVFGGMSLYFLVPIRLAGERTTIRAADIETGEQPLSRWLVIQGRAIVERPVIWTRGRDATHRAVAFVSEQWQEGQPVMIVLYCTNEEKWKALFKANEVEGIVNMTGVPSMEKSLLEKNGLQVGNDALFIEVDQDPVSTAKISSIMVIVAAGVVLCVVIFDRLRWASRRPKKVTRWDWKTGDRCLALWELDKYYYPGVVQEECGPDFQILLDDGREAWVTADLLAGPDIAPGTHVFARWLGGAMYFPGTIKQRDGVRFYILYDDGDAEWTLLSMIRVAF